MKKVSKERKKLEADLIFYLRFYKMMNPKMKIEFEYWIEIITEKLKEM